MTTAPDNSMDEHAPGNPEHREAAEEMLPMVYGELRRAASAMLQGAAGQTLQATALVHEAWIRLAKRSEKPDHVNAFADRTHFFAAAAEAMRHILIDRARRRMAVRHGGAMLRVKLDEVELASPAADDDELLAVNEALNRLEAADPDKAQLVKLRYFAGLTIPEAAAALGISEATAKRRWALARAWLALELRPPPET